MTTGDSSHTYLNSLGQVSVLAENRNLFLSNLHSQNPQYPLRLPPRSSLMRRLFASTTFCLLLQASISFLYADGLQSYISIPISTPSESYQLEVDGQPITVEKFGDVSYARFAFTRNAALRLSVRGPIQTYRVSPERKKIATTADQSTLTFTLAEPGHYIVNINDLEKLLLLSDPVPEPDPELKGPSVLRLADLLPTRSDPHAPVTAAFQAALDKTAAHNNGKGGVLIVPNGIYVVAQLKLKSNTRLHLESGALILADPDPSAANYPPQSSVAGDSSFIFVEGARNVAITGPGTIDGNGRAIRSRDNKSKIKLLRTVSSSHITLKDVYFRNSCRWTLHTLKSEDIQMQNVKIINDLTGSIDPDKRVHMLVVSNTDGIDIDACRRVQVENCFVYTGDDAITPKVTDYMGLRQSCSELILKNNVLWSYKCALKVGSETKEDIHDILFENNDILRADRAIALWSQDGGRIYNIRILNNYAEFIGGDFNERFFYIRAQGNGDAKAKPGQVDQVLIRDFFSRDKAKQASTIRGFDDKIQVTNVKLENIVIGGAVARDANDIPLEVRKYTQGITVE